MSEFKGPGSMKTLDTWSSTSIYTPTVLSTPQGLISLQRATYESVYHVQWQHSHKKKIARGVAYTKE